MEFFYREMRRKFGVLLDGSEPEGGRWNYDVENRGSLPKSGPGPLRAPLRFERDNTTKYVLELVDFRFNRHPGSLDNFDWPVTAEQADAALDPALAALKMGESRVGGKANVLVFPDLNSGNIAVKLVQLLAESQTFGQMLMGFTRPAADLPRGSSAEAILGMAALVGLQAIEYRKLYPDESPKAD
jgi:hypothetical protein